MGRKDKKNHSCPGFDLRNSAYEYLLFRWGSSISCICSGSLLHRRRPDESVRPSRHSRIESSSYSAHECTQYGQKWKKRKAHMLIKAAGFVKCVYIHTCVYLKCVSGWVLSSHIISVSQKCSGQFSQQVIGEVRIINPTLSHRKINNSNVPTYPV